MSKGKRNRDLLFCYIKIAHYSHSLENLKKQTVFKSYLFYGVCHHGHQDQRVKYDEEEKQNRGQNVVSMVTSEKEMIYC